MGSGYFVLKGNDIVSIKGTTSTSPVKVSVSSIIAYGQTNNYGNAFALYDAGNSRSGVAIRFFNISGDTAYLGTVSYINNSSYIGISDAANNNNITTRSSVLFGSNPDGNISGLPVAANFTTTSKGGITYLCNGGSVSSYSSSQAFYLPDTITNIYVDAVKYNTPTWKQIFVDDSIFFGAQGTIVDLGICEKGFNWRLTDQQEIENINQYLTGEMTDGSNLPTSQTEVYRKGTYSITASRSTNSGPGYGYNYYFKIDNEITNLSFSSGGNGNKRQEYKWALAIDEANQKAAFIAGGITIDNYYSYVGYANSNSDSSHTSTNLYNWLIGSGLLGATIKVNYYLPDYDYTYAKITYKQDSEPDSETDGESVEILKDETSVNIEGLEEEKTYYFKIFTDKSESEAFPFLIHELIDYGNMIFNDNGEITAARSSYTASTTPKFLVDMYKEKSTQSGYSYMNANANTWLIGPANNANGYRAIFGWTLPTNKDIYIICQNDTGQNAYYVWIWWDGFTSRDMLGTNYGYYKEINVQSNGTISSYQASTAINCYSGFSNNLTIDGNRYWSQTWLGGSETLKPIVWTEVNTSRIWVNGKKLT